VCHSDKSDLLIFAYRIINANITALEKTNNDLSPLTQVYNVALDYRQ